jgi:hypothetical protein
MYFSSGKIVPGWGCSFLPSGELILIDLKPKPLTLLKNSARPGVGALQATPRGAGCSPVPDVSARQGLFTGIDR